MSLYENVNVQMPAGWPACKAWERSPDAHTHTHTHTQTLTHAYIHIYTLHTLTHKPTHTHHCTADWVRFANRIKGYTSLWCCVAAHPGHVHYDMLWDVPHHSDKFGRVWERWVLLCPLFVPSCIMLWDVACFQDGKVSVYVLYSDVVVCGRL